MEEEILAVSVLNELTKFQNLSYSIIYSQRTCTSIRIFSSATVHTRHPQWLEKVFTRILVLR